MCTEHLCAKTVQDGGDTVSRADVILASRSLSAGGETDQHHTHGPTTCEPPRTGGGMVHPGFQACPKPLGRAPGPPASGSPDRPRPVYKHKIAQGHLWLQAPFQSLVLANSITLILCDHLIHLFFFLIKERLYKTYCSASIPESVLEQFSSRLSLLSKSCD